MFEIIPVREVIKNRRSWNYQPLIDALKTCAPDKAIRVPYSYFQLDGASPKRINNVATGVQQQLSKYTGLRVARAIDVDRKALVFWKRPA